MRIVYLFRWNEEARSGVVKKVQAQVRQWATRGHEVHVVLFSYANSPILADRPDFGVPTTVIAFHPPWETNPAAHRAAQLITRLRPDVVYLRQMPFYPWLWPLYRRFPVVTEVNTNDLEQYRRTFHGLERGKYWYHRLTRDFFLRDSAGFVFVSHEIATLPHYQRYGKPFEVIGNGIQLSRYSLVPPAQNPQPRLVFLGSPGQPWHGVDKVLAMARRFPQWHFDIIGPRQRDFPAAPPNAHFHGFLSVEAYRPLIAQADVAIGSLALHRVGIHEASPLKVREYLAWGLPVIIGYQDTDFPDPAPFLLQLPNTEDNVTAHQGQIAAFVARWQGRRVPRHEVKHLDVAVKEQRRLAFLQSLLSVGA